jgi:hypothetical protein
MLISQKQHAANLQNAQKSTGPKTPEGKEAVRFNALTWSLRARYLVLPGESADDYQQLWNGIEAEWQPQTDSERHYINQMCEAEWLLTRNARSESLIYEAKLEFDKHMPLIANTAAHRTRYERSYTAAVRELQHLQKNRRAQPQPQLQPVQAAQPPVTSPDQPAAPPPAYVMSEGTEAHPIFCAPAATDTR